MTREEFRENLTTAGKTFDGHVTKGSIAAQMKVVDDLLAEKGLEWTPAGQSEIVHQPSAFVMNSKRRIRLEGKLRETRDWF